MVKRKIQKMQIKISAAINSIKVFFKSLQPTRIEKVKCLISLIILSSFLLASCSTIPEETNTDKTESVPGKDVTESYSTHNSIKDSLITVSDYMTEIRNFIKSNKPSWW